jgi:hypothetical protein
LTATSKTLQEYLPVRLNVDRKRWVLVIMSRAKSYEAATGLWFAAKSLGDLFNVNHKAGLRRA